MSRTIHRLKALTITQTTAPGLYSDGGGLYLQITKAGVKSWLFRYMRKGKARGMGLGPTHTITLAKARTKAHECRELLLADIDPLDAKAAVQEARKVEQAQAITFKSCAADYHSAHQDGWRNAKHGAQWLATIETYANPIIGDLAVSAVDVSLVMQILEPIWKTKTETASRLRGRIEAVLDWATVSGYRSGANPARWKGHLDHLLISRSAARKVEHHPALPFVEIGDFIAKLRAEDGVTQLALEFTILCASRTSEVLNMTWVEVDLASTLWTIPAARMKGNREHRVPLNKRAVEILDTMKTRSSEEHVFPGRKIGKPLSNMSLLQLLKRMKRSDLTVHGFRSTFRDWCAEVSDSSREVAEMALAHVRVDKTEAAYARGDLFEKRRNLMSAWGDYCELRLTVESNHNE